MSCICSWKTCTLASIAMLFASQLLAQNARPLPADGGRRPVDIQTETGPRGKAIGSGEIRTDGARVTVNKPVTDGTRVNADKTIASMLAICNAEEVELAKLAKSKTENKDVREFAETMITDHSKMLEKLVQLGAEEPQLHMNSVRADNTSGENAQSLDPIAMKREIAQQCLAMAQKKSAETKSNREFDECYIGHQLVAHEQMLATLKVAHRHVSRNLQSLIEDGEKTTEAHKEHAEKLMKQLAKSDDK